ncbi:pyridoxamine 5'-phosphate oxidase family protein [Amycolatopsis magusensis]|uniref:pyridoxamine 5'-phosphate oxidase family protein n=1 Tax=Amycolatopsis magusensis TaxID=882444 RepID=UPI0024A7C2E6|nr:pyridoxamine 5'-phosphate oxidase family protein [Amycolatopsis magusensis]MDI5978866.1 pyridoxamine 5'-phosphate oxidase family protein [Amycolatopsis magusensis]
MTTPRTERPHMPGYDLLGPEEGSGLLPFSWAEEKFNSAKNYWIVSNWPDGRSHAMPVWAVWDGSRVWFSTGGDSRKARNLRLDERCLVLAENTEQPVVLEGTAELVTDEESLTPYIGLVNEKYGTDYSTAMIDPAVQATFRIRPRWVFGMLQEDFNGSPTRWVFD